MLKDGNPEEVSPNLQVFMPQIDNLILDEMTIEKLSETDKQFLTKFTAVTHLSLNGTKLKSLANLPDWKGIVRLEAAEN